MSAHMMHGKPNKHVLTVATVMITNSKQNDEKGKHSR